MGNYKTGDIVYIKFESYIGHRESIAIIINTLNMGNKYLVREIKGNVFIGSSVFYVDSIVDKNSKKISESEMCALLL